MVALQVKGFIIYLHISGKAHFIILFKESIYVLIVFFSVYEDCWLFHALGYVHIKTCIKEIYGSV